MRRALVGGMLFSMLLAGGATVRAEHAHAELRQQIESQSALLDSHTRRLYYEVRSHAEGDDEQAPLLEEARELWRAARRLNDQALDGAPAGRLEREVRRVENALEHVQQQYQLLRQDRIAVPPARNRLTRIDGLVHQAHDGVHTLLEREAAAQASGTTSRQPQAYYRQPVVEPLPRVQDAVRRPADYVEPPAVRVGPDGIYLDRPRFTIPFGR